MRQKQRVFSLFLLSPSSRRAWIEIGEANGLQWKDVDVALLAEGVDRNTGIVYFAFCSLGRPPRGGRG